MGVVIELENLPLLRLPPGAGEVSREQMLEAVKLHLCGAGYREVLEHLGVTMNEVNRHQIFNSSEWISLCQIVLPKIQEAVVPHLTSLESRLITEIRDRVENGDDLVNSEGVVTGKRRMRGRELAEAYAKVAGVKERVIERGRAFNRPEVEMTLHDLHDALTEYARQKHERDITGEAKRT